MNNICSCHTSRGERARNNRKGNSAQRAAMLPISSKRSAPAAAGVRSLVSAGAGAAASAVLRVRAWRLGLVRRRGAAMVFILVSFALSMFNVRAAIGLQANGFRG